MPPVDEDNVVAVPDDQEPQIKIAFDTMHQALRNDIPYSRESVISQLKEMANRVVNSPEEIGEFLQQAYPDEDLLIHSEETVAHRKAISEKAQQIQFEYIALKASTEPRGVSRDMQPFFKPNNTDENIAFNNQLRTNIQNGNYSEVAKVIEEYVQQLPPYDVEEFLDLTDEQVIDAFPKAYPFLSICNEVENLFKNEDLTAALSENTKNTLDTLRKHMGVLTTVGVRLDMISDPHYAFVDTDKFAELDLKPFVDTGASKTVELDSESDNAYLGAFSRGLGRVVNHLPMVTGAKMNIVLEKEGMVPENVRVFDQDMKEHSTYARHPMPDVEIGLHQGKSLVCRNEDGRITAYRLDGKNVVKTDPASVVQGAVTSGLDADLNAVAQWTRSHEADPFWMLTGSSQYRDIKRTMRDFQKLVKQTGNPPKPEDYSRLEEQAGKIEKAALDYMAYKKINGEEYETAIQYYRVEKGGERNVNPRQLARATAAFEVRNLARRLRQSLSLQKDLDAQGLLELSEDALLSDQSVQQNTKVDYGKALPAVSHEGALLTGTDALRQQIYNGLYGENGLLAAGQTAFTPQQQEAARELMGKMVIYDMIRRSRSMSDGSQIPSPMEIAYNQNPEEVTNQIIAKAAFAEPTPQTLQQFVDGEGYKTISDGLLKQNNDVPEKSGNQLNMEYENPVKMEQGKGMIHTG